MKGLEIRKLKNWGNDKGPVMSAKCGEGFVAFFRKKGTVFGNHYHDGTDPSKNPEIINLFIGKVRLKAKNIETGKEFETILDGFTELIIQPKTAHAAEALEDTVFIETRISKFDEENPDFKKYVLIEESK